MSEDLCCLLVSMPWASTVRPSLALGILVGATALGGLADRFGRRTVPSAVAWDSKTGAYLVGHAARQLHEQAVAADAGLWPADDDDDAATSADSPTSAAAIADCNDDAGDGGANGRCTLWRTS